MVLIKSLKIRVGSLISSRVDTTLLLHGQNNIFCVNTAGLKVRSGCLFYATASKLKYNGVVVVSVHSEWWLRYSAITLVLKRNFMPLLYFTHEFKVLFLKGRGWHLIKVVFRSSVLNKNYRWRFFNVNNLTRLVNSD